MIDTMIIGFVSNFVPDVIGFFKDRDERKANLELARIQMQSADKQRAHELTMAESQRESRLDEIRAAFESDTLNRSYDDLESARSHDGAIKGGRLTNALRASVRPVITYLFFALFAVVKLAALFSALDDTGDISKAIVFIWDKSTADIFGGIVGFWFGDRTRRAKNS